MLRGLGLSERERTAMACGQLDAMLEITGHNTIQELVQDHQRLKAENELLREQAGLRMRLPPQDSTDAD